jgi:hypothetical protein
MKTRPALILLMLLALADAARADIYQWTDREGVLHMTDDLAKVPDEYADKAKVVKTRPAERKDAAPGAEDATGRAPVVQPIVPDEAVDLYGGETIEWWRKSFGTVREEIAALETNIAEKRRYTRAFEGGRRLGQVFGEAERSMYDRYNRELPEDEKRLVSANGELDGLLRMATSAGVPKDVREGR